MSAQEVEQLRAALLPTPELQRQYLTDAPFHYAIDSMVMTLPDLVGVMSTRAAVAARERELSLAALKDAPPDLRNSIERLLSDHGEVSGDRHG